MPAFEDFGAEQDALDHARDRGEALQAQAFLIGRLDLKRAARLVDERYAEMDGRAYDVLRPAAEMLTSERDLAAASALAVRIVDEPLLMPHGA